MIKVQTKMEDIMNLKKQAIIVLSTALVATALAGCTTQATATAPLVGDDTVIASFTQGSINNGEFTDQLVLKAGMQVVLDIADQNILNAIVPVTDEMTAKVDSNIANIKNYYKDDFEASLKINGFKDEANFKESLILNEQRTAYTTNYVAEQITDSDVQAYYDNYSPQIEASHILIKPESDNEAGLALAKEKARSLIDRINAGEDFATLAKEFSADPGSGAQGGALGSFGKGQMVAEFEAAAFALEVGEVTASPVQTQFGFHIIKKTGGEEKKSFEEMKPEIQATLAKEKIQAEQNLTFEALIKLREDNGFEISNPNIAAQYALFVEQMTTTK